MAEQYHTTSGRNWPGQRRHNNQLATVPPAIQHNTGFWAPSQATPSIRPQINYPAIPNSQYTSPNANPAAQGEVTPSMLHVPNPPLTQEEWDALSASERAHVREAQDTQAALAASVEDQIRIEAIVKSYASRPPMSQTGHQGNDPGLRFIRGQHGYRPVCAHQPVPRPPAPSDVMCALCGAKEAVCQHPAVAGGVRTCEACFDEMHMAEQRRSS